MQIIWLNFEMRWCLVQGTSPANIHGPNRWRLSQCRVRGQEKEWVESVEVDEQPRVLIYSVPYRHSLVLVAKEYVELIDLCEFVYGVGTTSSRVQ